MALIDKLVIWLSCTGSTQRGLEIGVFGAGLKARDSFKLTLLESGRLIVGEAKWG